MMYEYKQETYGLSSRAVSLANAGDVQAWAANIALCPTGACDPASSGQAVGMSDFTLIERHPVPRLRLELQVYAHPSGARHIHLANDDAHRAFAVAFRTVAEDNTGLPHILEHLSLCGSRRFPARDPFFMMLRRSLQTFMNAFTYPDMTCYPFATQVAKDFDHLLDIYLDAVFAPRLDALDFAQEGWRLEPAGRDRPNRGLIPPPGPCAGWSTMR